MENPSFFGNPLIAASGKGEDDGIRFWRRIASHVLRQTKSCENHWQGSLFCHPSCGEIMRNQPISSSVLPGIIQLHSITQYFRIGYFIFPSPTVWVLVWYNEPCMARWFSGCFFEPMSLAWRVTNWKRYDYSCWFQKSLVDFLPFRILGFNKYIQLPNLTCTCFSFMHGLGKTTPHLVTSYTIYTYMHFFHNANVLEGSHQRRGTFHRGNEKTPITYFSLYRCELWIA